MRVLNPELCKLIVKELEKFPGINDVRIRRLLIQDMPAPVLRWVEDSSVEYLHLDSMLRFVDFYGIGAVMQLLDNAIYVFEGSDLETFFRNLRQALDPTLYNVNTLLSETIVLDTSDNVLYTSIGPITPAHEITVDLRQDNVQPLLLNGDWNSLAQTGVKEITIKIRL